MRTAIINGFLVLEQEVLPHAALLVEQGRIAGIGTAEAVSAEIRDTDRIVDAQGGYIFPGFIDLHVHGAVGFHIRDEHRDALDAICAFHARHGTTSLLLTTTTMARETLLAVLRRLAGYMDGQGASAPNGARVSGIHLEGPFLSREFAGAQEKEAIQRLSTESLLEYVDAASGRIRLVTLAPELPGAEQAIACLTERRIVVSAGHSGATYEQMMQAVEWGVTHVTHCYNGMRGFRHREPGLLAAAWLDDRVTAEYIADGIHSHPAAGRLLIRQKGCSRVALITDAVRQAGLQEGSVLNAEGKLAGSTLTMAKAVRNAVKQLGVGLCEAARMASLTPARVLGAERAKGSIALGKEADLVVMDEHFQVKQTMIQGHVVYRDGDRHE